MLFSLFLTSFLAATLLPGGSEAVFVLALLEGSEHHLLLLGVATLGNTMGALISYGMGRAGARYKSAEELAQSAHQRRVVTWLTRHGTWALLLSWAPVVGDMLCLAAGWLRLKWVPVLLAISVGKAVRYAVVMALAGVWI